MILCVGTTPAEQRVMVFRKLTVDAVNRAAVTCDGVAGKSINVAKVLRALGATPVAAGFLGGERGKRILAVLRERGIAHSFVQTGVPTRQCVTVIDETAGTHTELVEESRPVPAAAYAKLRARVRQRVAGCRALVLSGTITPGGPTELYCEFTSLAKARGALTVVDAQGPLLVNALAAGPGLIKPNRAELAATVGRRLENARALREAMRELCGRGAARVVVTAGKGATVAYDGRAFWRITPPAIDAVNPIGSGDAFTAGLVWRLLRGDDLGEACRWASATGAANALTMMAGEIQRKDVARLARKVDVARLKT
jgi:1-phosphofructokinase family hexose kinase